MVPVLVQTSRGSFAMSYEPVLPSALVVCKSCTAEGLPLVMPRVYAARHDRMFHPEEAEPDPPVLQEAKAS
jgi:hypothetical protein